VKFYQQLHKINIQSLHLVVKNLLIKSEMLSLTGLKMVLNELALVFLVLFVVYLTSEEFGSKIAGGDCFLVHAEKTVKGLSTFKNKRCNLA
jgi:hypothetical protein